MKTIRRMLLGMGFLASLNLAQAQQTVESIQPEAASQILIPAMNPNKPVPPIAWAFNGLTVNNASLDITSVADLQTMLEALQSEPPISLASLPRNRRNQIPIGGFWSLQHPYWPPLPADIYGMDVWPLGNGNYIIDDRQTDYAAVQAVADTGAASPMMRMSMMASSLANSYAYGNAVYLTSMASVPSGYGTMTASFSIAGGTNFVPYDILTITNIATSFSQWNWLGLGYTSNRYTFASQPAGQSFYLLAKPSKTMTVGLGDDSVGQCDVPFGLTNALQVAGGGGHSLALLNNGTVAAWGWNAYGQASVPTNLIGVAMVSAGWYHSVALLTNGTVTAWGYNAAGLYNLTAVPSNLTNATVIAAQALHTLALRSDGTVVSWGYNYSGETNVPAGLSNVVAISAGYEHSLAVSNGTVIAWGGNPYGQCNVPAGLSNVVDVAAGLYHSLALLQNGTVVAWGDNADGESSVPVGLTNVVAIAAGGDPGGGGYPAVAYSLALKSDGTVVAWGDDVAADSFGGLSNVIGIAAGADHALAVRTGPRTPVITLEPTDQYQVTNGTVIFTSRGAGLYGVTYQWQFNSVNITGATNAALTVTNVQGTNSSSYTVVVTDKGGMGGIVSSNVSIHLISTPVITSETLPTTQFVLYQSSVTLSVVATAPGIYDGFPLSYQWQFNGTNILGATSASHTFTAVNSGTYSLNVSNAAGGVTVAWQIYVEYPGGVIGWGSNSNNQLNASSLLTNAISLAAGKAHGVVALDSGSVSNWGSYWTGTNLVSVTAPPSFTNALAVAAGSRHDLALKTDGTVVAWGLNDFGQTNVPANATNIFAIAAGGQQCLALQQNGIVMQWGQTNAPIPAGLTNVTAIAAGTNFALALLQNSTVIAWGADDYGQTNIPAGLTNVVAIAAGGSHAMALQQNGTVVAWGAWTNVPANLTNAMNVAAGENHSVALKNDGTVIAWGDNTYGQTSGVSGLTGVKLIAGGGNFTLAVQFSMTVMYPVDVANDLLLIYNTNSADSATVLNYYLAHRPMVSGAIVLGIGFTNSASPGYETFLPNEYTNELQVPVQAWLAANPTKRPQYVVLFYDVPSRVSTNNVLYPDCGCASYDWTRLPSVQHRLNSDFAPVWNPFVTSINMGSTNDCIAYINKLEYIGTNYSPGKLVISASASGYGNTNYYFDDTRYNLGTPQPSFGYSAETGVLNANPNASVIYSNTPTPTSSLLAGHITNGVNVAGFMSWGVHGYNNDSNAGYAINGDIVFNGNSGWYLMQTAESFNGQRYVTGQGHFTQWFSSNAFGGTNYFNIPVGAVCHTDEPGVSGVSDSGIYFGLWEAGKDFGICAWNSKRTPNFQAVGDPLVTK